MPKLNYVKRARKARPKEGIEFGDSYYHWQFPYGPILRSKTKPTRSQLTESSYLRKLYDLQDGLAKTFETSSPEEAIESVLASLRIMLDECKESLENMPEHLRENSPSGTLLAERIGLVTEAIKEIESLGPNATLKQIEVALII